MKQVLMVGLGRFGRHMGSKLCEEGNEVLAVDCDEARVNDALNQVTYAQIGDATNDEFMSTLGVRNFDLCVVAIGDDFQSSLEATSLLKELGAQFVLARASRDVHAKFLLRNGADQVVYPEREIGEKLAVKYGCTNIFDYMELDLEYSIYEISTPASWVGKSIAEIQVRNKYQVSVLATKVDGHIQPLTKPEYVFCAQERLLIMGHNNDVRRLIK